MIQITYTLARTLLFLGSNSIVLKVALPIIIDIVLLIIVIVSVCSLLRKYKKCRQDNINDMVFNPAYSRTSAVDMVHNPAYATNAAAPRPPSDPTVDEEGYMRVDNY